MNNIEKKICALKIEWNWKQLMKCRKAANLLLDDGQYEAHAHELLELSERANSYANQIMLLQSRYDALAGVRRPLLQLAKEA